MGHRFGGALCFLFFYVSSTSVVAVVPTQQVSSLSQAEPVTEIVLRLRESSSEALHAKWQEQSTEGKKYLEDIIPDLKTRAETLEPLSKPNQPSARLRQFFVVGVNAAATLPELIEKIKLDDDVVSAAPNYTMSLQSVSLPAVNYIPNDYYVANGTSWREGSWGQTFPDLWGHEKVRILEAFDLLENPLAQAGQGILVGVVDTGIDFNHPEFANRIYTNAGEIPGDGIDNDQNGFIDDVHGWDFGNNDNHPQDSNGHGSHVSGTIAANMHNQVGIFGLAPNATILPVKAFSDGFGSATSAVLAQALVYAAENGARVINNSWGCIFPCPSNPIVEEAVRVADDLGAIVVFAAGNSNMDTSLFSPQNMTEPLVVASVGADLDRSFYSNFGQTVDVSAPGGGPRVEGVQIFDDFRNILSVTPLSHPWASLTLPQDVARQAGTSMAAPHVAGLVAFLLSVKPWMEKDDLILIFEQSSVDLGAVAADPQFGNGLIDARRSLEKTLIWPDCNNNNLTDAMDVSAGTSADVDANGQPDECQSDCNGNLLPDTYDISTGQSVDCNNDSVPNECESDCDNNQTSDICDMQAGATDCNADSILDRCDSDCNSNTVSDVCEIFGNASLDLNHNQKLDSCEPQVTLFVDDNAPGDPGPGNSQISNASENGTAGAPFDSIQKAIDYALAQNEGLFTIFVRSGTYTGVGNNNIFFHGFPFVVRGENVETVILDLQNSTHPAFVLTEDEGMGTRIEALTLKNKAGMEAIKLEGARGVVISSCRFLSNNLGIWTYDSELSIEHCRFERNRSGGVFFTGTALNPPSITDSEFIENGMEANGTPVMGAAAVKVAGLSTYSPSLRRCMFRGNKTIGKGAAFFSSSTSSNLQQCQFLNNHSTVSGGAFYSEGNGTPQMTSCVFVGNRVTATTSSAAGGAIFAAYSSQPFIQNCSFLDNSAVKGGAIATFSGPSTVENCLFWENTSAQGQVHVGQGTLHLRANAFEMGSTNIVTAGNGVAQVTGSVVVESLGLVDAASGNCHIDEASPCRNAGNAVTDTPVDTDGEDRVMEEYVDIGADEFNPEASCGWMGDLNGDGIVDGKDIADFSKCLVDPESLEACQCADLNNDGEVTTEDASVMIPYLVGSP